MAAGRLAGRTALVTGAGTGIGRAIALAFAQEGAAQLALAGRRREKLEETAALLPAHGTVAHVLPADLLSPGEARRVVREACSAMGRLDVLVNNAGIYESGSAVATDEETWDRIFDVNLKAAFLCSKEAVSRMIAGRGGSIVNVASYLGLVATRDSVAYCASKAGMVMMTRAMALDHARHRVRVNAVCPGGVDTPMLRRTDPDPEDLRRWADEHPLGRVGTPEEVAQAAVYLCSEAAAWITGTALTVDGGISAGW